jgi:hypothetical protein
MGTVNKSIWALMVVVILAGAGYANWEDSFDGGQLTLTTWQFLATPDVMKTYKGFTMTADDGNGYLVLQETSPSDIPTLLGAAFGGAFASPEKFKDVRVGATLNVTGNDDHSYYGLFARTTYIIDADGSLAGIPGFFANCYIMHIDYSRGPANLNIELEKVLNDENVMDKDIMTIVPRLENARSYYAELEVVGAGPVYVTGRLYEFKGGPLVAQTPTMVDTNGKDWWEDAGKREAVYTEGVSGVFGQNEDPVPPGFYCTFDDISSSSDPTPVLVGPANGATDVSMRPTLSWVEAAFATSRQLWFGPAGNMQLVSPDPAKGSFDPGLLALGQTYQWRVDQVGPSGTVTGHTWQFTTGHSLVIDDFESYADSAQLGAAWVDNIPDPGYDYALLETGTMSQGAKAMRLLCYNQFDPFLTEATRTFAAPQDWTTNGVDMVSLAFRGVRGNVEQPMYVTVEDEAGKSATVTHSASYAIQSEPWRTWVIPLSEFSDVDLTTITKMTVGVGNGISTEQAPDAVDTVYFDNIRLGYLP